MATTQVTIAEVTTNILAYKGLNVCITTQLAEFYGCSTQQITQNFNNNKDKFTEGNHFFKLTGTQMLDFIGLSKLSTYSPNAPSITLWTKKGAMRHAKMLTTEKAWGVFEQLEDSYFKLEELKHSLTSEQTLASWLKAAELLEVPKHLGQIEAVRSTLALTGVDYSKLLSSSPAQNNIPNVEVYLIPTDLGKMFNIGAVAVNNILRDAGLQVKGPTEWTLTEAGKKCGFRSPWTVPKNAKTGYHNKWCVSKVLHLFKKV